MLTFVVREIFELDLLYVLFVVLKEQYLLKLKFKVLIFSFVLEKSEISDFTLFIFVNLFIFLIIFNFGFLNFISLVIFFCN